MIDLAYTVTRSRRRTLGLQLLPNGELMVRAPLRADAAHIDRMVRAHARWIERARMRLRQRPSARTYTFAPGTTLPYLGQEFTIRYSTKTLVPVVLTDSFELQASTALQAKKHLEQWYRRMALHHFSVRLKEISARHQIAFRQLRLSSARTRWGSCSGRGTISVVWRLIFAPPAVIDYVLCHELAHIVHHNHRPQFWKLVHTLQPDFELHRQWLRTHGYTLNW